MQYEFVFAGFGGQGIMFAGQLLTYVAMDAGFQVTWIPSYGPEKRGGTAFCQVMVSESPIGSPVIQHPRIAVVFNSPSFDKYEPLVASGGFLAYNSSLIDRTSQRTDLTQLAVPATELATQLGDLQLANMVMLGAVLTACPVVTLDAVRAGLQSHLPAHRRAKLDANFQALEAGARVAAPER